MCGRLGQPVVVVCGRLGQPVVVVCGRLGQQDIVASDARGVVPALRSEGLLKRYPLVHEILSQFGRDDAGSRGFLTYVQLGPKCGPEGVSTQHLV